MKIEPTLYEQVRQVLISLILASVVSMLVSATTSSFTRTTAAATTIGYGILISLYAGTMLIWLNRGNPFSHSFVERSLSINPMAVALAAMEALGFKAYNNIVQTGWRNAGILCASLLVILYLQTRRLSRPD